VGFDHASRRATARGLSVFEGLDITLIVACASTATLPRVRATATWAS